MFQVFKNVSFDSEVIAAFAYYDTKHGPLNTRLPLPF